MYANTKHSPWIKWIKVFCYWKCSLVAEPKLNNNVESFTLLAMWFEGLNIISTIIHHLHTITQLLFLSHCLWEYQLLTLVGIMISYMHIKQRFAANKRTLNIESKTVLVLPQKYRSGNPAFCQAGLWMSHPTSCGSPPGWPNPREHRTAGTN